MMSQGYGYMHSHSGLERTLTNEKDIANKSHVLIDECFKDVFAPFKPKPFKYKDKKYYKVPTLLFFEKGGVFRNLEI